MLESISYVNPEDPPSNYIPWEGLEDRPFTKVIRKVLLRGVSRTINKFSIGSLLVDQIDGRRC